MRAQTKTPILNLFMCGREMNIPCPCLRAKTVSLAAGIPKPTGMELSLQMSRATAWGYGAAKATLLPTLCGMNIPKA